MKLLISAIALVIAAPVAAQVAPADPHAGHAQQHGGKNHEQHGGDHKGHGCCKDMAKMDCCKDKSGAAKAKCCAEHDAKSGQQHGEKHAH
jgi:hypothetical protein